MHIVFTPCNIDIRTELLYNSKCIISFPDMVKRFVHSHCTFLPQKVNYTVEIITFYTYKNSK